ncbi:hypothetical protein [Rhizobium sp. LjRoot254]|uniref:hypothetical protein n=1 Tax=Rhizobium sp. LjRoot254 TaxID=3342297 RepID=UPI003ECC60BA
MDNRPPGASIYEQYAVGFLRSSPTVPRPYHCGSGTLVSVGGVHGILTAGHVLNEIERDDSFRMLSTTGPTRYADAREVVIETGATIRNWDGIESRGGPDIAFLRLPNDVRDWALLNRNFYNYSTRYDLYIGGSRPLPAHTFYTFGMIGESSEVSLSPEGWAGIKSQFIMLLGDIIKPNHQVAPAGPWVFVPETSASMPHSFGGLSGAGVWAINEAEGALGRLLLGVAYFQDPPAKNGIRNIIFQGVDWSYDWLIDTVAKKFPEEFQPF